MYTIVKAHELQVGDVISATSIQVPISVKEVTEITHPVLQTKEIKVRGPLSIVEKYPYDAEVRLARRGHPSRKLQGL